jgi:hypothetical protein
MIAAAKLGGYYAAHAIWCVADGERLTPILAYTAADGQRHTLPWAEDELRNAFAVGMTKLATNEMNAKDAALIYDSRLARRGKQQDAIVVELRTYSSPQAEAVMAVPYVPKASGCFRVRRPRLIEWKHCGAYDRLPTALAFWDGAAQHPQGWKAWNDALDETNDARPASTRVVA